MYKSIRNSFFILKKIKTPIIFNIIGLTLAFFSFIIIMSQIELIFYCRDQINLPSGVKTIEESQSTFNVFLLIQPF